MKNALNSKTLLRIVGTQSRRLFGPLCAIALAAVIAFTFAACDDGSGGGGGPETLTYKGKGAASGDTYTLTITKTAARAFTPIQGDEFELTDGTDKSKGKVDSFNGSNLTLQPSYKDAPTFDVTVSGNDLTGLSGTITLTDGRRVTVDETLTPVSPPGGGGNMTWTLVADNPLTDAIYAIAYGGSAGQEKFIAGGWIGKMATSPNGITWTAAEDDTTFRVGDLEDIAYGNGTFVGVGGPGTGYSVDGINWTAKAFSMISIAIAYGNNKFVAVGDGGDMAYSSDNGKTWTAVSNSTFGSGSNDIYAIAYGGSAGQEKFVAAGRYGKMAYSADGVNWTAVADSTFGTVSIRDIAYGKDKFVAVGYEGKMAYSANGVTWTSVADSGMYYYNDYGGTLKASINAIAFGNNKFVAVGSDGAMAFSSDGVNWTAVTNSKFDGSYIYAITYGNGTFVAGGSAGKMAYSTGN